MRQHDRAATLRRPDPFALPGPQAASSRALVRWVGLAVAVVLVVVAVGAVRLALDPARSRSTVIAVAVAAVVVVAVVLLVSASRLARRRAVAAVDATSLEQAASAPLLARVPMPDDATALPALDLGAVAADPFRNLTLWWESETRRGPLGHVVVAAASTGSGRPTGSTASAPRAGSDAGATDVWWTANLAIALAGTGRATLLIDARMGERFAAPDDLDAPVPDTPGLHDVLTGTAFDAAISPGPTPGLSVLPPGRHAAAADPDLLAERFAAVAEQAGRRFDAVVVLAPGLDQGNDAAALAVDGALLLVVPAGRVGLTMLRARADRVRAAGGRVAGLLLVEPPRPRPQRAGR